MLPAVHQAEYRQAPRCWFVWLEDDPKWWMVLPEDSTSSEVDYWHAEQQKVRNGYT